MNIQYFLDAVLVPDILRVKSNKSVEHGFVFGSAAQASDLPLDLGSRACFDLSLVEVKDVDFKHRSELPRKERYYFSDGYLEYAAPDRLIPAGRFSVEKHCNGIDIIYTERYRKYSENIITRHDLPERIASAFSFWSLLERGLLALHCAAVHRNGTTALLFALPDTGKTRTAMELVLDDGWQFIADDIVVTDGKDVYSAPYTRSGVWQWDDRKRKRKTPWSKRTNKSRVFDYLVSKSTDRVPMQMVKPISKVDHIFILGSGREEVRRLDEHESLNRLAALNRFEFELIAHRHLLASASLAAFFELDDLTERQSALLRKLISSAEQVLSVDCIDPADFRGVVSREIGSESRTHEDLSAGS